MFTGQPVLDDLGHDPVIEQHIRHGDIRCDGQPPRQPMGEGIETVGDDHGRLEQSQLERGGAGAGEDNIAAAQAGVAVALDQSHLSSHAGAPQDGFDWSANVAGSERKNELHVRPFFSNELGRLQHGRTESLDLLITAAGHQGHDRPRRIKPVKPQGFVRIGKRFDDVQQGVPIAHRVGPVTRAVDFRLTRKRRDDHATDPRDRAAKEERPDPDLRRKIKNDRHTERFEHPPHREVEAGIVDQDGQVRPFTPDQTGHVLINAFEGKNIPDRFQESDRAEMRHLVAKFDPGRPHVRPARSEELNVRLLLPQSPGQKRTLIVAGHLPGHHENLHRAGQVAG